MTSLFQNIDTAVSGIFDGWTSVPKAQAMAAMIVALRPKVSLEIGVYAGKGLVAMGLAHKAIGQGIAIGVDPYSSSESIQGQLNEHDRHFWGTLDHERIYNGCAASLKKWELDLYSLLVRQTSHNFQPPNEIGMLRIDGNHGERAFSDAQKFAPKVELGGFLILDDVDWTGGHVSRAAQWIRQLGWKELYRLDDGIVFQRTR